ncbi:hypothetical protein HRI_000884500 [Hibiscus trionum]|uniref:AIG1-type G domain-containing protein n=1 Tax=Hibiscus trionum TaxID=183268 RepID=A0A9W7LPB0_HIBTR|nr:hypothetical protein HRI_000884500 [Hibiscus trionum]
MDAKPSNVSVPSTKETPSGSLLIRAPLTVDSDSEYDSNGRETASTVGGSSFNSFDENNSELGLSEDGEGFLSGNEEFDTVSEGERPLGEDPERGISLGGENDGGVGQSYKIYVANKDDDDDDDDRDLESLENNSMVDEDVGLLDGSKSNQVVVPIAQLSMDDEVLSEEETVDAGVEDGGFSGVVKVPGSVESSPRIKVASGDEEDEPLVNQYDSSAAVNSEVENGGLEDFVVEDKGSDLEGSQKDVMVEISKLDEDVKPSADTSLATENPVEKHGDSREIEGTGSVMVNGPNHDFQPVDNSEVEKGGLEDFGGEDKGPSLEGSQKDVVVEISKLDEDVKPSADTSIAPENLVVERVESKCGNGHEIEENGSVIVESDDKVVMSDLKELSDIDSVDVSAPMSILDQSVNIDSVDVSTPMSILDQSVKPGEEDIDKHVPEKGFLSDDDVVELIFGSSETTKQVVNEVDSEDQLETASHQVVIDSDEEAEAEREYEAKELQDSAALAALLKAAASDEEAEAEREYEAKELLSSAALAALLKAAAGGESDGAGLTITSHDGSRVFPLDHPAHSGSSFHSSKVAPPSNTVDNASKDKINDEDKQRFEKLQLIRVKFLRLVERLGHPHTDPMVAQVLYQLALASGSLFNQEFTLESAKRAAMQLEAEGKDDLDFSLNILILGKTGVGKSASVNSILCEQKSRVDAFQPATTAVKEIVGTVDGVKMRIFDTPGLRSPVTEEATNRKLLASMKRFVRKFPPDVVLYVDRLDGHDKDLTDVLLLRSLTDSLGSSIWQNAIVTLTHAASASPEGAYGEPLSFEVFVAQRSHVIHRAISQAVGDLRLMNPSMQPVALVENHPSGQRDGNGEMLLPNGQSWRSQLLLLCYSVKILSETSSLLRPQEHFDHQKLFGFRLRSPPLPYLLSSLLQSRPHPKLPNNDGSEDVDLDTELRDSYSGEEDNNEYDQLPSFKPLKRSQVDKLSKEQRKAYYEEYDYRVKLLQKKQWREEVERMREIKKKRKDGDDNGYVGDDGNTEEGDPATIQVPLPDMVLPPSFDGDNPTYRYRFLDSASQLLIRPVLDPQAWDHDIGYDGVSLERSLAIAGYFPGAFAVQITKDKREFNIHLDSSVCAKHGENGSTMAGFDIQTVGKQLAYIFRGETKFRNFEANRTTAGLSVTFLGENIATGLKIEDQIAVGKRLLLAGSAGAMRSQGNTAYGANIEIQLKDEDFPIEQNQTSFGLSLVKWKRDLGLMANLQSQFSIGRGSSMAVRVGLNNKQSGQISIKTSSSDQLHIALVSLIPIAASIFRMVYPGSDFKSSAY